MFLFHNDPIGVNMANFSNEYRFKIMSLYDFLPYSQVVKLYITSCLYQCDKTDFNYMGDDIYNTSIWVGKDFRDAAVR